MRSPVYFARLILLILIVGASCKLMPKKEEKTAEASTEIKLVDGHPSWILQGNIYEVNVRQYTPEGTFKAFSKHLPRLQKMGVQTLWFMPIHPISLKDRKGVLGSYYAVSNYVGINPEFGTMNDWKDLVNQAHKLGMKVIIDWVPNHTGADHYWLEKYPDFYAKDSSGKVVVPFGWEDVRKLDYSNNAMADSMINSMKFWVKETGIDGFRCDVAGEVPDTFWKRCLPEIKKVKGDVFFLAETDKPSVHEVGFNATYPWAMFHMMKKVATGERYANALDSALNNVDTSYPANALKVYFTSNHDENSWNKADYATMPGRIHAPFAVLTQTLKRGVPIIYSGQEEPTPDSISFFYKDTMSFNKLERSEFYTTLLHLRKNNPALAANASFKKINVGDEKTLYAFVREAGPKKVLVITNLSGSEQTVRIREKELHGKPLNVFMKSAEPVEDKEWKIEPWGYVIYEY